MLLNVALGHRSPVAHQHRKHSIPRLKLRVSGVVLSGRHGLPDREKQVEFPESEIVEDRSLPGDLFEESPDSIFSRIGVEITTRQRYYMFHIGEVMSCPYLFQEFAKKMSHFLELLELELEVALFVMM